MTRLQQTQHTASRFVPDPGDFRAAWQRAAAGDRPARGATAPDPTFSFFAILFHFRQKWVNRLPRTTLHRNGRTFLVDAFAGNETMADSVNHLLVVGFYLINIGYIALALRYGDKPTDWQTAVEFLSTRLGLVLVVLGAMHFGNLYVFNRMRTGALQSSTVSGSETNPSTAHLRKHMSKSSSIAIARTAPSAACGRITHRRLHHALSAQTTSGRHRRRP